MRKLPFKAAFIYLLGSLIITVSIVLSAINQWSKNHGTNQAEKYFLNDSNFVAKQPAKPIDSLKDNQ